MPWKEKVFNIGNTIICAGIAFFFAIAPAYEIKTYENQTVIIEIEKIQYIGLLFIFIGIIGYLLCFWNFIIDAKGSPMPGDQNHLMTKGLYRYVRNPMYISFFLIILGEGLFFQSKVLFYYLFGWMVFFQLRLIFFEEPGLRKKFEESYVQYCRSVRRWIPRLKPYQEKNKISS